MQFLRLFATLLFLFSASIPALADESCHFQHNDIPRDEARILALAGVRPEWKCDYDINYIPSASTFLLFAELYSGTDRIARYRLAFPVNETTLPRKGVISLGWNEAEHQLTGVVDNGQFYSPWTYGPITLPQFSPTDSHFFETSQSETRHSEYGDGNFVIYPVLGIRGQSNFKSNYMNVNTAADFLKACQASHAQNAIIVYVYNDPAYPPLHFQKNDSPSIFSSSWLPTRLGLACLIALVVFCLCWFFSQRKHGPKKAS